MQTSLEDHAVMRLAGESNVCLCDEYSHLVLHQAAEIKTLKKKLRIIQELCHGQSKP